MGRFAVYPLLSRRCFGPRRLPRTVAIPAGSTLPKANGIATARAASCAAALA